MPRAVYFEIRADNPERAAEFYRRALGWDIKKSEGGEYWRVITGPTDRLGINGGIVQRRKQSQRRSTSYISMIAVESLDDILSRVSQQGGRVVGVKRQISGIGWVAHCQDTEGNMFGLFQADRSA